MAMGTGLTIEQLSRALARGRKLVEGALVDVSGNTGYHDGLRDALLVRSLCARACVGNRQLRARLRFRRQRSRTRRQFLRPFEDRAIRAASLCPAIVPDPAIEIVSPNDKFEALFAKALRYRRCGTKEATSSPSRAAKCLCIRSTPR